MTNLTLEKLKCFEAEKYKTSDSKRLKNQIRRLQNSLSEGKVWIKFEYEHTHTDSSYIKRIEYLLVTSIVEHQSSFPYTIKITHDERLITEFRITKGKITYTYDPVWQNSKNYTRLIDKEFSISSKIPKKIKALLTEYITKERKRINDWADSWFNFVKDEKHT